MSNESIVSSPLYERRRRHCDRQSEMQRRQLLSHSLAEGEGGEECQHDAINLSAIDRGVVLARCRISRETEGADMLLICCCCGMRREAKERRLVTAAAFPQENCPRASVLCPRLVASALTLFFSACCALPLSSSLLLLSASLVSKRHWQQRRPLSTKQMRWQRATRELSADAEPPRVSSIKFGKALCGVARPSVHCSMGNERTALFATFFGALQLCDSCVSYRVLRLPVELFKRACT